jgi:Gpi18-like mannosyltransferase
MKKRVLLITLGVIMILSALSLFTLFLMSLNENGNVFYLVGSLTSMCVMVYCFINANRFNEPDPYASIKPLGEKKENFLETNNAMIKEYNQTEKTKERLHMLELAGSANKE